MDKKNLIKISITILTIIIIIIIIILCILNKVESSQKVNSVQDEINLVVEQSIEQVSMTNDYFIVKDIIDKFYSNCKQLNSTEEDLGQYKLPLEGKELQDYIEEGIQEKENLAKEVLYGLLDSTYINEFDIMKDNIKQKFGIQNEVKIIIEKMYKLQNSTNVFTYFIYGTCIDTETSETIKFNLMVSLDMANNTYSIYPEEYLQKHGYDEVNVGEKLEIQIESIEGNGYNTFEIYSIEDSTISKEYFYNYKNSILYDTENAYEMLEEEYREKKFGGLEEYKRYIQNNYDNIKNLVVTQYQVVKQDDMKEYVCLDQNNNYYIFSVSTDGSYKLYLDTYTIDLPEFTEKYNTATEQQKVALNINKIITALNAKDYKYIYSKLADSFKNNYFESEEALQEYLVNNLFDNNVVEFEEFSQEGTLYTYKIKVTKIISEEEKEKYYGKNAPMQYMNIVMQLNEGTDFVMSFSIEE